MPDTKTETPPKDPAAMPSPNEPYGSQVMQDPPPEPGSEVGGEGGAIGEQSAAGNGDDDDDDDDDEDAPEPAARAREPPVVHRGKVTRTMPHKRAKAKKR